MPSVVKTLDNVDGGSDRPGDSSPVRLETLVAGLESAEDAVTVTSTKAGLICLVLATTNPGGHVIASQTLPVPAHRTLRDIVPRLGRRVSFLDVTDSAALADCIGTDTQLILAESLSDSLMVSQCLDDVVELAHSNDLVVAIENSLLTGAQFRPLEVGIDLVIEAGPGYLDGFSGISSAVISGPHHLVSSIRDVAIAVDAGGTPSGGADLVEAVGSLPRRMVAHDAGGDRLAGVMARYGQLGSVRWRSTKPPPWAWAASSGSNGLLAFDFRVGEAANVFASSLVRFRQTFRPGSAHSSVDVPAQTHATELTSRERLVRGMTTGVVRLAVGLEDLDELEADVVRGLELVEGGTGGTIPVLSPSGVGGAVRGLGGGAGLNGLNLVPQMEWARLTATSPWEGLCRVQVAALCVNAGVVETKVLPMQLGSRRVVRNVETVVNGNENEHEAPSPLEVLLAGLGASIGEAIVVSLTGGGRALASLELNVSLIGLAERTEPDARIRVEIRASGGIDEADIRLAEAQIARRSTVLRSLSERRTVRYLIGDGSDEAAGREQQVTGAPRHPTTKVVVRWEHGLQFSAASPSSPWRLRLDEPSQVGGSDGALSPEEAMLAALAAERVLASEGSILAYAAASLDASEWLTSASGTRGVRDLIVKTEGPTRTAGGSSASASYLVVSDLLESAVVVAVSMALLNAPTLAG